jgi:hypothetical protein
MDEKELLVICHCKSPKHLPLYRINKDGSSQLLGPDVEYVDPWACPDTSWKKISDNSKKYIWGINCPVALPLQGFGEYIQAIHFLDILSDAWKKLKPNGMLHFGAMKDDTYDVEKIRTILQENDLTKNKWIVFKWDTKDFPFYVSKQPAVGNNSQMIIFKKIVYGGRRRTRQHKSNHTYRTKKSRRS